MKKPENGPKGRRWFHGRPFLCFAMAGALILGAGQGAFAQSYPSYPSYPGTDDGRDRDDWGGRAAGAAVGLGVGILLGIARDRVQDQRRRTPPPQPDYAPPPGNPNGPQASKPKKPKRVRRVKRSKRAKIVRVALPEVIRLARPKPVGYRIGFKPLVSKKHFVVALKPGIRQQDVEKFISDYGLTRLAQYRIELLDQTYLKLAYPENMAAPQLLQLGADARLQRAQPSYLYYPAQAQGSEDAGQGDNDGLQYALDKLNLTARSVQQNGSGVTLAVIDSGISARHPALADRVAGRFSAFEEGSDRLDTHHGTAVASIIAAQRGMRGVASGVRLLSAQVFATSEEGYVSADSYDIARGIDWAVANGANILNLSFAGAKDALIEEVLRKASERGVIAIAAAGNEGVGAPAAYPAAYEHVIAVTATDSDDGLYDFANRGGHVEIAAPGVDILVATGDESYALESGTSMAAAYISGSVALMLERVQDLSPSEIQQYLAQAARDLGEQGRDPNFGHGLLDAGKAVAEVRQPSQ